MSAEHSREPVTPGTLLRDFAAARTGEAPERVETAEELKGFGGFHGGLALGVLTTAMARHVPGLRLESVTGRFGRVIDGGFTVDSAPVRSGRTSATVSARATSAKGVHLEATGVFSVPGEQRWTPVAPKAPEAPAPEECEVFAVPREFVPVSQSMEIRPVGSARPYAGGPEPELLAWIRLLEDDEAPDAARFVFLMDGLAPSYAAILSELVVVPTVELTVRPAAGLATADSPWILLRARTLAATPGGWIDEQLDAWGRDGTHLGTAHQLRLARAL